MGHSRVFNLGEKIGLERDNEGGPDRVFGAIDSRRSKSSKRRVAEKHSLNDEVPPPTPATPISLAIDDRSTTLEQIKVGFGGVFVVWMSSDLVAY